jgi:hypothetical protein
MTGLEPTTPPQARSDMVFAALDRAAADGTTLVFEGNTTDLFVTSDTFTRLPHLVALWGARRDMPTVTYTLAGGVKHLVAPEGPRSGMKEAPPDLRSGPAADVTALLKGIVAAGHPTVLILDFAESVLPNQADGHGRSLGESIVMEEVLSQAFDRRLGWVEGGHRLVLVSRTCDLQSCITEMPGVTVHQLGLPASAEREAAIRQMVASTRHRLVVEPGLSEPTVARLAGGMSLDALSRLRYATDKAHPLTRGRIAQDKSATIRKLAGSTLTVFEEDRDLDDVAGLPQVRLFLEDMRFIGRNTIRLTLAGPPGNGKTLVALAIAKELGVPAVALHQIKDMWVGNSEKALGRALNVLKEMPPTLLVVDEVDQTIGGSRAPSAAQESSSVDSSHRDMFMEFTSDNALDNGISIICMSNNPRGIDPAIRSRFETVAVLEASSPQEMADVVAKNTAKVGAEIDQDGIVQAFTESPKRFSGRELVDLLIAAQVHAARAGRAVVGYEEMARAVAESQQYSTRSEQRQALSAVAFTHSSRYLPWNASRILGAGSSEPPAYLADFVAPDGSLRMEALRAEIEGGPGGF